MTIETNKPTYNKNAKSYIRGVANHLGQHWMWTRCPRCIGGNMYQERNGKYVYTQCGCSYYPDESI